MAAGDEAWTASLTAPAGDRAGLRRTAFDAWQGALLGSEPGAAVRVVLPGPERSPFLPRGPWDPSRAAEGVQDAVLRRLMSIAPEEAEVLDRALRTPGPGGPRRGARRGPRANRRAPGGGRAPVPPDPTLGGGRRRLRGPRAGRGPPRGRRGLARPRDATARRAREPRRRARPRLDQLREARNRRPAGDHRRRAVARRDGPGPHLAPPASPARGRAERGPARALPHRHPPHRGDRAQRLRPLRPGPPLGARGPLGRRRARPGRPRGCS